MPQLGMLLGGSSVRHHAVFYSVRLNGIHLLFAFQGSLLGLARFSLAHYLSFCHLYGSQALKRTKVPERAEPVSRDGCKTILPKICCRRSRMIILRDSAVGVSDLLLPIKDCVTWLRRRRSVPCLKRNRMMFCFRLPSFCMAELNNSQRTANRKAG